MRGTNLLWVILGLGLILAGFLLFETVVGLALIPVGLVLMGYGGKA
jgi:hypothetical protein